MVSPGQDDSSLSSEEEAEMSEPTWLAADLGAVSDLNPPSRGERMRHSSQNAHGKEDDGKAPRVFGKNVDQKICRKNVQVFMSSIGGKLLFRTDVSKVANRSDKAQDRTSLSSIFSVTMVTDDESRHS